MNWLRRLYTLWKFDRAIIHLFHAWLYMYIRKGNTLDGTLDAGDQLAFELMDGLLADMLERRKGL